MSKKIIQRFVAARLTPEGELGLHLTAGIALLLLAGWLFGELAEDVVSGARITVLDVQLAHWFHSHATPGFTRAMLVITHCNGILGGSLMGIALAVWFWRRHARYWLIVLLIAAPGGLVLNGVLKHIFQRARPHFDDPLLTLDTYSFPSGHTASATVFYGVLACYLIRRLQTWPARSAVAVAGCAAVLLVALSRMYLGAHYLSDVLAAMAEGAAWLAICIPAVATLHRRRIARGRRSWSQFAAQPHNKGDLV